MQLAFFKIFVSFLLALALTWLAERKSLFWSGILTAFPNVSLFTMIFLALEQGVTFTTKSSLYGVYGVMNNMIFASVVILATFYISSVWIPFLLGIFSYAIFGFLIVEYFPRDVYFALILAFLVWLSCLFIWKKIPKVKIHKVVQSKKVLFLLQFGIISVFILFATYIAPFVKEAWAGVISAYPSLTTSIGLIILIKYSKEELRTFCKSAILGWLPTAVYLFSIVFTYERFGLLIGTLISVLIAGAIVILLKALQNTSFVRKLNY